MERHIGWAMRALALAPPHVSHLRLTKMANDRIHMNTQAGSRLRKATAIRGRTEIGSQPIDGLPSTTSADALSSISLSDKEVTLHQTGESHKPSEVGLGWCEQNCEPVRCGRNGRDSGVGCIRRWRSSPMKYGSPRESSWPRSPAPEA